jgi:outer membrane usher protein FimD/PapC
VKRLWPRAAATCLVASAVIGAGKLPILASDQFAAAAAEMRKDARTFATFLINSEERGEYIVEIKADGVYANIDDLRAAGLIIPHHAEISAINGSIRLADLAPEITPTFDPQGPTVRLDAQTTNSLSHHSDISVVSRGDQSPEASHDKSGYLNYNLSGTTARTWSGAQELTLSDTSKTLFLAGTIDASGYRRSQSNLTWTDDVKRRNIVVGDVLGDSGDLGSSQTLEGVTIARSFESTPYEQRATSPTLEGMALTPSVADIYINGHLIKSVDVPVGEFDFHDLPAGAGSNDARIVLRDSFGQTQILSTRYYGANTLLRAGETDYSYSVGESQATAGENAGVVALGRYAVGISRSTTIGTHAELANSFENIDAGINESGRLGISHLSFAESRNSGVPGAAGSVGYMFSGANVWANATFYAATANYAPYMERSFADRSMLDARLSIGIRPFSSSYTATLSYVADRSRLGNVSRSVFLQQSLPLSRDTSVLVGSGFSQTATGSHPNFSLLVLQASGKRSREVTSLSLQSNGSKLASDIEVQRAAPIANGTGFDANFYPLDNIFSTGRYIARTSVGEVDVDYGATRSGSINGSVAMSGAIAFAGKSIALGPPIADGFAIVKVDGGERVQVLNDNQDAGMTNRQGLLVLPNLRSYYDQSIGIVRSDGPVNLDVSSKDQSVVVAAHRGVIAKFSASVVTAIIGKVAISEKGGLTTPAFGRLSIRSAAKTVDSELDRKGRFYFEDVAAGKYDATIRYAGGECRFALTVPQTSSIEQNIGDFTCDKS